MKFKILLAGILFLVFQDAHAQKNIPKGSILLGGDLSFSSYKYTDENNSEGKSKGFSIFPSAAIGIKDNLFAGISLGFGFYKNTANFYTSSYDSTTGHGYSIGLFLRKYKPLKSNFYLFLQGGLGANYQKREIEDVPNRTFYQKDLLINLSISPGVSYAINSKLQIETGFNNILGIGYSRAEFLDNNLVSGKRTTTGFSAYTTLNNFNSQIYLGFRLLLQKINKTGISSKKA